MSPRTAEQNQVLRDASRERILEAALRLFSRRGYASASIRGLAAEAGVAQGLLYSHFRGKQDLLRALFKRSMDDVRESFAAAAGEDGRPPLERLVHSALAILRRNLDFWRLSYGVRMQEAVVLALGPDLKAWTRDIKAALESHFRSAGAGDPGVQAALFFAAFDGLCQHYVLDPEEYPLEAVAQALLERFPGRADHGPVAPHPRPKPGGSYGKPRRRP